MAKLLKITLLSFSIILILLIGTVLVLPLIIDPNDFKPEIEAFAYQHTGKKLVLEGSLKFSVFPWLGISTGKALVYNLSTSEQQALAAIDEGHIKIKLLPLLAKKIELSRIVLKSPVIHLITDKQGNNNWNNISSKSDALHDKQLPDDPEPVASEKTTASVEDSRKVTGQLSAPKQIIIAGVSIENGKIDWLDEQKVQHTEINQINLDVNSLTFNQPASIDLSLKLKRQQDQSGQFLAKGLLTVNRGLDQFELSNLEMNASIDKQSSGDKITIAARSNTIDFDRNKQDLKISGLNIRSGGLALTTSLSASKIKDKPDVQGMVSIAEFNLRDFLAYLGKPIPATNNPSSLTRLSGSFELHANKNAAEFNNLNAALDDSNISGYCHISDFKQPAMKFNLNIDSVDLDRYLISKVVPKNKPNTAAPGRLKSQEKSTATVAAKTVAKPKSQDAPEPKAGGSLKKAEQSIFPIEFLRKMNAAGELSITKMTTKGMSMQDLKINLDAKDGVLKTTHKINKFYQGRYSGNFHLDVNKQKPVIALDEKFVNIQTEPLLKALYGKARLTGTLNGKTRLSSQGNTAQTLKARSKGKVQLSLKKGVINGFNLQEMVKKGKAILKQKDYAPKKQHTDYSIITAKATINNGLVKNDDLYAESERLRVSGKGTLNLVNEQLDYDITANLMKRKQAATDSDQVKRALAINVAGSAIQPTYTLDLKSLITEQEKQKLYDKAEKKLGKDVSNILKQLLQ